MIAKHDRVFRGVMTLLGVTFVALLLAAADAAAEGRIGQYLVGRLREDDGQVVNPTDQEMFCVSFLFTDAGDTLNQCNGAVVAAKETNDDDLLEDFTGDTGGTARQAYIELLCVPSTGKQKGSIARDGKGVGVIAEWQGPNWLLTRAAKTYQLPADSSLADDVVDCACQEMSDAGVMDTLFKNFGIVCP